MQNSLQRKGSDDAIEIDKNIPHELDQSDQEEPKKQSGDIDNKCPYLYKCKIFQYKIEFFDSYKWKKRTALLTGQIFQISNKIIAVQAITKLKCYSSTALPDTKQIKISHNESNSFFAASTKVTQFGYPIHFNIFAKIINAKNTTMNLDLFPKLKSKIIHQTASKIQELQNQMHNIAQQKIFVKGVIYKKSKYQANWNSRFIIINSQGMLSFNNPKSYSYKVVVKANDLKQIWTRFQFFNNCLIFKVLDSDRKTQLAIPLADFCCQANKNWLYGFYRMMK